MCCALLSLLACLIPTALIDDSPRMQYDALVKEFDVGYKAALQSYAKATSDEARMEASEKRPQPPDFAPRFLAIAEKYPNDPAAFDALIWVASKCLYGLPSKQALEVLVRDYRRSERLSGYCDETSRYGEPFLPYEKLLRAVLKDNPHREVKARACLALASHLKMAKETTEKHLIGDSRALPRPPDSLANFDRIKARGLENVATESATLFEEVIEKYADVRLVNSFPRNAGEFAKAQLSELRNLGVGSKAPEIVGRDAFGKEMKLSDYRGKVVVLDFGSHRSCVVCRKMYPQLRDFVERYEGKPVVLLGISVDDDVKELRALSEKREMTWSTWWDGENLEGPIAARWFIRSMPTFYVIDQDGVIRNKGTLQADQISDTVEMLLKRAK